MKIKKLHLESFKETELSENLIRSVKGGHFPTIINDRRDTLDDDWCTEFENGDESDDSCSTQVSKAIYS